MSDFDVIIAGAGPAGCAAAISLCEFAPDLRVCLIDADGEGAAKVGDTVPPTIAPMLRHLGLWTRFVADQHRASYRGVSAWGQPQTATNEYLFRGDGVGWQLDRAAFEAALRDAARTRVAHFATDSVTGCIGDEGLHVVGRSGLRCSARFGIDATGRAAALSRAIAGPPEVLDRLIGCVAYVDGSHQQRGELLVESFADGWWYTACLPRGRRVIACMTDADQVRHLGLTSTSRLLALLSETHHIRDAAQDVSGFNEVRLVPANSRRVAVPVGVPLLPIGDAAFTVDPVSGQGIVNGMRTGILASYAVTDWLRRGDDTGLRRYRAMIDGAFDAYRTALSEFYAAETRWSERPFWHRRQADQQLSAAKEMQQ